MSSYQCSQCGQTSHYLPRDRSALDPVDYARCVRENIDVDSAVKLRCKHCGFENLLSETVKRKVVATRSQSRDVGGASPFRLLFAIFMGMTAVGTVAGTCGYFLIDAQAAQGILFTGVDLPAAIDPQRLTAAIGLFLIGAAPPLVTLPILAISALTWRELLGEKRVLYGFVSGGATLILGAVAWLMVFAIVIANIWYAGVGYIVCLPLAVVPWIGRWFLTLGQPTWLLTPLSFPTRSEWSFLGGRPQTIGKNLRTRWGIVVGLLIVSLAALAVLVTLEFGGMLRSVDNSANHRNGEPKPSSQALGESAAPPLEEPPSPDDLEQASDGEM